MRRHYLTNVPSAVSANKPCRTREKHGSAAVVVTRMQTVHAFNLAFKMSTFPASPFGSCHIWQLHWCVSLISISKILLSGCGWDIKLANSYNSEQTRVLRRLEVSQYSMQLLTHFLVLLPLKQGFISSRRHGSLCACYARKLGTCSPQSCDKLSRFSNAGWSKVGTRWAYHHVQLMPSCTGRNRTMGNMCFTMCF